MSVAATLPLALSSSLRACAPHPPCTRQAPPECRSDEAAEAAGDNTAQAVNLNEVGGLFVVHVGFLALSLLVFLRSRCVNGCCIVQSIMECVYVGGGGGGG